MKNIAERNPAAVAIGGTVLLVIAAVWIAYAATAHAQVAPECPDASVDLARIADAIERLTDVAESARPQPKRPYQCGPVGGDGKRVCEPMPDGWEPMPDGWRPW